MSYGQKSNLEYFMSYGFVNKENIDDFEAFIKLEIDEDDDLRKEKE